MKDSSNAETGRLSEAVRAHEDSQKKSQADYQAVLGEAEKWRLMARRTAEETAALREELGRYEQAALVDRQSVAALRAELGLAERRLGEAIAPAGAQRDEALRQVERLSQTLRKREEELSELQKELGWLRALQREANELRAKLQSVDTARSLLETFGRGVGGSGDR
jgi:hypothetical protein